MYESVDILSEIIPIANKFVLENDRTMYKKCYRVVEEVIADRKWLLSGNISIELLLGKDMSRDSLTYEIYTNDVWNSTKYLSEKLCNSMSSFIDLTTVTAETLIKDEESIITVETRVIAKLSALPKIRGGDYDELLNPIMKSGHHTDKKIRCVGPILHLMSIYRGLYRPLPPTPHPSYSELLDMELSMAKFVDWLAIDDGIEGVYADGETGGADDDNATADNDNNITDDDDSSPSGYSTPTGFEDTLDDAEMTTGGVEQTQPKGWKCNIDRLLLNLANRLNCVVIGDYAFGSCTNSANIRHPRVQWLGTEPTEELLKAVSAALRADGIAAKIDIIDYDLHLLGDFQTRKQSIYIWDPNGKRVPIADVFNAPNFELVPYVETSKFKRGGLPLLIRFRLIDLFSMKFIGALGGEIAERTRNIQHQIFTLRREYLQLTKMEPLKAFPLDNYMGVYLDETVERKKSIGTERFRFSKYHPCDM